MAYRLEVVLASAAAVWLRPQADQDVADVRAPGVAIKVPCFCRGPSSAFQASHVSLGIELHAELID